MPSSQYKDYGWTITPQMQDWAACQNSEVFPLLAKNWLILTLFSNWSRTKCFERTLKCNWYLSALHESFRRSSIKSSTAKMQQRSGQKTALCRHTGPSNRCGKNRFIVQVASDIRRPSIAYPYSRWRTADITQIFMLAGGPLWQTLTKKSNGILKRWKVPWRSSVCLYLRKKW